MTPYPKSPPFRSQALRDLAAKCPECMNCGAVNMGQVVGAHSNQQAHGKGLGHKAHDLLAYLCDECHRTVDAQEGNPLPREERERIFLAACYRSTVWLLQAGHLVVRRQA